MRRIILIVAFLCLITTIEAFAQGNIYGTVNNSNMSIPVNGDVYFIGYINNCDNELRIESCIGAGFDEGNWYDDFQNYTSEAPGLPYSYHFLNLSNGEGTLLSSTIPSNSFQQENVVLSASSFPPAVADLSGYALPDSTIKINWTLNPFYTYRVYRRPATSDGSFNRIDNPSGDLSDNGISEAEFIDNTNDRLNSYDYLVIAIDNGTFGIHSTIATVNSIPIGSIACGDANNSGTVNLLDVTYLIRYLYQGGPPPDDPISADVNSSGGINLLDVTYLIRYLYQGGSPPDCP